MVDMTTLATTQAKLERFEERDDETKEKKKSAPGDLFWNPEKLQKKMNRGGENYGR